MKKASVLFKVMGGCVAVTLVGSFLVMDLLRVKVTEASVLGLPEPNVILKASREFSYPILRGVKIDYNNPLNMDFIIDTSDQGEVDQAEAQRLINYFYATVAVPNESLWVNLSPYEQDRVVDDSLKETDLGRDLLAQDYVLKQFSSSLTYPESETGENYWEMLKETNGISDDSFNKIWIMPDSAKINEENGMAWVSEASLTAQLEADYMAAEKNSINEESGSTEAMREIVLPKVINEINNGKNFAKLRQIYYSMLLGMWFKKRFKESFFANLIEQENVKGIEIEDKEAKEKIYKVYKKAFEQGVYRMLKKEKDLATDKVVKREYFSGGFTPMSSAIIDQDTNTLSSNVIVDGIIDSIKNKITEFGIGLKMLKVSFDEKNRDKAKFEPTANKGVGGNLLMTQYGNELNGKFQSSSDPRTITPEMRAEIDERMKLIDELIPVEESNGVISFLNEQSTFGTSGLRGSDISQDGEDAFKAYAEQTRSFFNTPSYTRINEKFAAGEEDTGVPTVDHYNVGSDGLDMAKFGTSGLRGPLAGMNIYQGSDAAWRSNLQRATINPSSKWAGDASTPYSYSNFYVSELGGHTVSFMFYAKMKVSEAVSNFTKKLKKSIKRSFIESRSDANEVLTDILKEGSEYIFSDEQDLYSVEEIVNKFIKNKHWSNQDVYDSVSAFRDGVDGFVKTMHYNVDEMPDVDLYGLSSLSDPLWARDFLKGDDLVVALYNQVYQTYVKKLLIARSEYKKDSSLNVTGLWKKTMEISQESAAIVRNRALDLVDFEAYEAELVKEAAQKKKNNKNTIGLVEARAAKRAAFYGLEDGTFSLASEVEDLKNKSIEYVSDRMDLINEVSKRYNGFEIESERAREYFKHLVVTPSPNKASAQQAKSANESQTADTMPVIDELLKKYDLSDPSSSEHFTSMIDELRSRNLDEFNLRLGTSGLRDVAEDRGFSVGGSISFNRESSDASAALMERFKTIDLTPSHISDADSDRVSPITLTQVSLPKINNKFAGDNSVDKYMDESNSLSKAISDGLVLLDVKFENAVNNFRAKLGKFIKRTIIESRENVYVVMEQMLKDGGNELYSVADIVGKLKAKGQMTESQAYEGVQIYQTGIENFAIEVANRANAKEDINSWAAGYFQNNKLAEGLFKAFANKYESRKYFGDIRSFLSVDQQAVDLDLARVMAESEKNSVIGLVDFDVYQAELAQISNEEKVLLSDLSAKMRVETGKTTVGLDFTDVAQMKKDIEQGKVEGLNPNKVDAYVSNIYELNKMSSSVEVQREGGISMQELDDKLVLEKGADAQGKMFANVDYDFSDGINYTILALKDITGEEVLELAAA